jgi:hypothetical protein
MMELAALGGDTIARLVLWWSTLAFGAKLGIGGGLGAVGLVLFWLTTRKLARRARKGRQRVLVVVACVSVVLTLLLGVWAYLLPEPERVSFVLADQIVRVGAALSGTISILLVMVLSLPWALDRLERQGFVNFVAARHVRADKSGFLTVISILSIAGAVRGGVDHGRLRRRPEEQDPRQQRAHQHRRHGRRPRRRSSGRRRPAWRRGARGAARQPALG